MPSWQDMLPQILQSLPPEVAQRVQELGRARGAGRTLTAPAGVPGSQQPGVPAWQQLRELGLQPTGTPAGNRELLTKTLAERQGGPQPAPMAGGAGDMMPAGDSSRYLPGTSISVGMEKPGGMGGMGGGMGAEREGMRPPGMGMGLEGLLKGPPPELMDWFKSMKDGGMPPGMRERPYGDDMRVMPMGGREPAGRDFVQAPEGGGASGGAGGASPTDTSTKPWQNPKTPEGRPTTFTPRAKPVNSNPFAAAGQDTGARPLTKPPVRPAPPPGSPGARARRQASRFGFK